MASTVSDINFFDAPTNDCPYAAYEKMRDESPVWKDPVTGMYILTRYEDIRTALLDTSASATRSAVELPTPGKR